MIGPMVALVALCTIGCSAQLSRADVARSAVTVVESNPDFQPVTEWLVVGPFPSPDRVWRGNAWPKRKGFEKDYLESLDGESGIRPTRGMVVADPDGNDLQFLYRHWPAPYIDITDVYGRIGHVAAYIYAELESDSERDVYLHIGSNDAAKLWVGGELVLAQPEDHPARPSQNVVRVHLVKGRTPVLMKIDQSGNNWGAFVEIATQTYRPACSIGRVMHNFGVTGIDSASNRVHW
jgi:hypothetical protein